ncbi:MAG: MBL fold metallo-hydrolase [Deltaproteobacteria bacterium]|nr:MBL fold metallo-hydrolase [Deltaproteobacteria bacterium]
MVKDGVGIKRLKTIISNVWLFTDQSGDRYLIDSGHTAELPAILISLRVYGIKKKGDLKAILLTHRHSDHAANAEYLSERFSAKVYAHKNELPFLRGDKSPSRIPYGIGKFYDDILIIFENRRPATCKNVIPFEEFSNKDFEIYDMFGHTEGSVFIYHKVSKILFSGDVLFTGIPAIGRRERLFAAVKQYSNNVRECHRRLYEFLQNPPQIEIICSGHGPVVTKNVMEKLASFREKLNASK